VGLNIKNEETHRLVAELAALTGESKTAAIQTAVLERLERLKQRNADSFVDEILALGRDCAGRLKQPFLSLDHGDLLYDEHGLPR
jgi:antitoxin VapB